MNFQTFSPTDALKPYVKHFYTLGANHKTRKKKFRTIADGCPGILFQKSTAGSFYQEDKALPATFLFGQSTQHSNLSVKGNLDAVGVYLHPHALHTLFGLNAELLTDTCMDLSLHSKSKDFQLFEKLEDAGSSENKIELISAYLLKELKENRPENNQIMQFALQKIQNSKGTISLKTLLMELQTSERSFERNFKQYVGISPKLFSRICNFQASLRQLNSKNFNKLSDIAYEHNYADQSHFIRSFKQFAGLSPNQFQKKSNEVVENLSELL